MENLEYLVQYLKNEIQQEGKDFPLEGLSLAEQYRALVNVRKPKPIDAEFLKIQDEYLSEQTQNKGVITLDDLEPSPRNPKFFLWQGDITRLAVDAIVNAANSQLLGCFAPLHACIDNAIHTAAGVQLREDCHQLMLSQGHLEATGRAKITKAYNLPSSFVLHTVGPIIHDKVRDEDRALLASCYESCLHLADENGLQSVAFCCISTGVFRFPNAEAAQIAVETVSNYFQNNPKNNIQQVVFNVFLDKDLQIYEDLLN